MELRPALRSWNEVAPIVEEARRTAIYYQGLGNPLAETAWQFVYCVQGFYQHYRTNIPNEYEDAIRGWLTRDPAYDAFTRRLIGLSRWGKKLTWSTIRDRIICLYHAQKTGDIDAREIRYILNNWRRLEGDIHGDVAKWETRKTLILFKADMDAAIGGTFGAELRPSLAGLTDFQQEIVNMHRDYPRCYGLKPDLDVIAAELSEMRAEHPELTDKKIDRNKVYDELREACRKIAEYLT